MTRPIYQVDRDMAEAAIRRAYEQGREHEEEDTRAMVHALALAFKEEHPDATVAEFASSVLQNLLRRVHEKKHEGKCLGSRR